MGRKERKEGQYAGRDRVYRDGGRVRREKGVTEMRRGKRKRAHQANINQSISIQHFLLIYASVFQSRCNTLRKHVNGNNANGGCVTSETIICAVLKQKLIYDHLDWIILTVCRSYW